MIRSAEWNCLHIAAYAPQDVHVWGAFVDLLAAKHTTAAWCTACGGRGRDKGQGRMGGGGAQLQALTPPPPQNGQTVLNRCRSNLCRRRRKMFFRKWWGVDCRFYSVRWYSKGWGFHGESKYTLNMRRCSDPPDLPPLQPPNPSPLGPDPPPSFSKAPPHISLQDGDHFEGCTWVYLGPQPALPPPPKDPGPNATLQPAPRLSPNDTPPPTHPLQPACLCPGGIH